MRLNYDALLNYQNYWQTSIFISPEKADKFVALSNIFMQRVTEHDGEIDDVVLLYPEDCNDRDVFMNFAEVMSAYVGSRLGDDNALLMDGWLLHRQASK